MKSQTITLKITYDDLESEDPSGWDWRVLLDLLPDEEVEVLEMTDPIEEET